MPKMKREAPSLSGKAETAPGGREDRTSEKAEKTEKAGKAGNGGKNAKRHRFRWMRIFEKPDFRVEREFLRFGKRLLFVLLVLTELLVFLQMLPPAFRQNRWAALAATLGIEAVLSVSEAVKLFAVRGFRN